MYIREQDAKNHICHETWKKKEQKPCKGKECMAWVEAEWKMTPCPHCGKEISATDAFGDDFGRCGKIYRR
jgi:hypothetical protein